MSWYRQIKTFYTISINMFFFIIWGVFSSILLNNKLDYRLYFVSLASAFLLQFIMAKLGDKVLSKMIAAFAGVLFTLFISKGLYFIFNSLFIVFILYMANIMEYENVNYDAYKDRARNGLIFIIFLGALLPLVDINLSKSILKFYIMFLVSNIVVMREARSYYYKIRTEKSNKTNMMDKIRTQKNFIINMIISLVIFALSVDVVFTQFLLIINYILKAVGFIVNIIIDLLGIVLAKPMLFVTSRLRELLARGMAALNRPESALLKQQGMDNKIAWLEADALEWLYILTRVIITIVIIISIFAIISKLISHYGNKEITEEVYREKIKREKIKEKGFFNRLIKNLITPSGLRNQILNIYRRFEEKTFEKGIFKRHMTAKQLENVTKTYIEKTEGLSSLTMIYNEAKFSKHELNEESLKVIKEEFSKVKKQL